jgi:DNA-directed RNA polymerase specialized sigma24 family protein
LDAEGLSHSEIARMTGASYSAVRWTRIRQSYRGA